MRIQLFDGWVDLQTGAIERDPPARLTPTERRLLGWLAARPNETATAETLLQEVWGYHTRVRSRTVTATVHRMRAKLEADPKQPRHLITVWGEGFTFVPVTPEPQIEGTFVGRQDLLEQLVAHRGVVALVGWGGVGKTRLALELLDLQQGTFCDLTACFSTTEALRTIAWTLGLPPERDLVEQLAQALPHRGLVVLDNLEQIDGFDTVLERWAAVQGIRLVLTTRLLPQVPDIDLLEIPPLQAAESEALLRARGVRAASEALRRLGTVLDGNPLALELAAHRLELLSVEELMERTDQLEQTLHTGEGRHASLRAVVDWTLQQLAEDDRRAAFQLAELPPFELPVGLAEAVVGDLSHLETLQRTSLLRRERGGLRLPIPVHAALSGRGDAEEAVANATQWLLAWAEPLFRARDHTSIQRRLPPLTPLLLHLRDRQTDAVTAARLAACALEHLYHTGTLPLALELVDEGLRATDAATDLHRRLQIRRARVLRRLGRADEATALASCIDATWPDVLAFDAWQAVCSAQVHRNATEQARDALEHAQALQRHVLPLERALLSIDHATLLDLEGARDEAYRVLLEGWEELQEAPAWYRLIALTTLGNLALRRGRRSSARSWMHQAVDLATTLGPHMAGVARNNLATLELTTGELDAARRLLELAAQDHRQTGQSRGESFALFNLGRVAMLQRDWARALVAIERATARFERNQIWRVARWSRAFLAIVLCELGEIEAAQSELASSGADDAVGQLAQAHLARARGDANPALPTEVSPELAPHVQAFLAG